MESDINGVIEMPDSSRMIRRIVGSTAGIWLISLLAFCSYCQKKDCVSAWEAGAFGIWMIAVFAISYVLISRIVNKTMERVDDCIQSLIDGQPDQQFSTEEESLLGKFQMQILKLYRIMDRSREMQEQKRGELAEMVADLVHQVNTPLTNIQLYCSFLTQDDLTETDRSQICQVIDSQVEKLGWFADGFGKAARLEGDVMKIRPETQPVLDTVLQAIDQVAPKAQKNGNEVDLLGDKKMNACYDRRWTEEALFNLLDNAVKYGRKESAIVVELTAYSMFVRIDIKNEGDVIPRKDYNKLFSRFYRGENSALVYEGVGLGLYLARKIIMEQGGYIKVSPWEKKGNIFSIFLRKR